MAQLHIDHSIIKDFGEEKVNLPRKIAQQYRDQVNRLRDRLTQHIAENPGFALVKMLHAGSVSKGTALRTINDLDAAVYVKKEEAPVSDSQLVPWLADRLRESNPNLKPDQFDTTQPHCVTVSFRGTGLDVDVVPVLYEGDANDLGYLVDKYTGERMLTSIPRHLEFIRTRKNNNPDHFAQVVRLAKWWTRQRKELDPDFKCKSFIVELIIAHLADQGIDLSDYEQALEGFFNYVVKTGLEERIAFTDYYPLSKLPNPTGAAIEIFDPINPLNNIASKYTVSDRQRLVSGAEEAADAISEARYAVTQSRAIECWQLVFGQSFRG
jgi:hypothetical protein